VPASRRRWGAHACDTLRRADANARRPFGQSHRPPAAGNQRCTGRGRYSYELRSSSHTSICTPPFTALCSHTSLHTPPFTPLPFTLGRLSGPIGRQPPEPNAALGEAGIVMNLDLLHILSFTPFNSRCVGLMHTLVDRLAGPIGRQPPETNAALGEAGTLYDLRPSSHPSIHTRCVGLMHTHASRPLGRSHRPPAAGDKCCAGRGRYSYGLRSSSHTSIHTLQFTTASV